MLVSERTPVQETESNHLDMATIRKRVAAIKRHWTPTEVAARAAEGRRRRRQLQSLIDLVDFESPCKLR